MLTQEEKLEILNDFPNVKLSYEKTTHKKVYNFDFIMAIPEGKKCFAWFTLFKNNTVCILFELDNKNKKEFKNIKIINSCFSSSLCYGTLLFGTLFYHMNNPFFSIEDIYFYKSKDLTNYKFSYKFNVIVSMFKSEIRQLSYNNSFVVFGLPVVFNSDKDFSSSILKATYKVNSVKYIKHNEHFVLDFETFIKEPIANEAKCTQEKRVYTEERNNNRSVNKQSANKQSANKQSTNKQPGNTFICKPDIQNDIYHLYSLTNEYIGVAAIPDYKTSKMMNALFRTIKENDDLDALEESDDEEEFENCNSDKFVYLDRAFKMLCNYNYKFKKWVPIKITE